MKLPNVTSVEIKPGKKEGTQLAIVKSSEKGITKEQAVKSLGDKAERFVVKTWNQGGKKKKTDADAKEKKAS
ncbi:MAG: hypothetical protein HKN82_06220 [Akkermansiaceae bacterium]|nr:hypothetical protein [Akkermansiaceae bacterium]NNM30775.1 hypothetical protein [Akkermansiaceae bacterium]